MHLGLHLDVDLDMDLDMDLNVDLDVDLDVDLAMDLDVDLAMDVDLDLDKGTHGSGAWSGTRLRYRLARTAVVLDAITVFVKSSTYIAHQNEFTDPRPDLYPDPYPDPQPQTIAAQPLINSQTKRNKLIRQLRRATANELSAANELSKSPGPTTEAGQQWGFVLQRHRYLYVHICTHMYTYVHICVKMSTYK
jgi:hypothetical protein